MTQHAIQQPLCLRAMNDTMDTKVPAVLVVSSQVVMNRFTGISNSVGPANLYLFFANSAIVAMALPI